MMLVVSILQLPPHPQHRFGSVNTLALHEDLAVVGAPGLEVVYVWERVWHYHTNTYNWTGPTIIRASDYDYDYVLGKYC